MQSNNFLQTFYECRSLIQKASLTPFESKLHAILFKAKDDCERPSLNQLKEYLVLILLQRKLSE